MAQNLELKILFESFKEVESILSQIEASDEGILDQKDTYYQYNKGLLKLRRVNGRFELIKYLRDEKGERRWSNYQLLQLEGENVEEYLNDILSIDVIVEKIRHLFIYKNTRIHLDDVKNLGNFLELETIVDDDQQDAKERFDEIVNLLKLDRAKEIKASYRDLIKAK